MRTNTLAADYGEFKLGSVTKKNRWLARSKVDIAETTLSPCPVSTTHYLLRSQTFPANTGVLLNILFPANNEPITLNL